MSDDLGRRRRLTPSGMRRPSSGGSGWLITIVAAIVVVVAGWFLGMALARFANSPKQRTTVAQITPSASPTASPSPAATATSSPSPKPKVKVAVTTRPTSAPTTVAATPTPTAQPTVAPTPARRLTMPVARRPLPTPTPRRATPAPLRATAPPVAPAAGPQGEAESTVRNYIDSLRRGDPEGAAVYLGNGSPDESFIDSHTRIVGMNTALQADGTYVIAVTMQTTQGRLIEIFNVGSTGSGDRILEKNVTRP